MHELPVTQNLLEIALRHCDRVGADRVTDLHVVIGALSSYIDDSVTFYWELISEGTAAEGAKLHFHRPPLKMTCQDCASGYQPTEGQLECTHCGSSNVRIVEGEEFYLESIDVERVDSDRFALEAQNA